MTHVTLGETARRKNKEAERGRKVEARRRKAEGRLDRDAEEEREVGQGAQEQTSPASSPIRNPGWLKPPTKKQKPGRKRQHFNQPMD